MAVEIERRFLVRKGAWRQARGIRVIQGYLSRDKHRTVRVCVAGEHAFLTVKGLTTGASRVEFEYGISVADGEQLLKLCLEPLIDKVRRIIARDGVVWEVDEFLGDNAGLVVAEIELQSEDQQFAKPDWLGAEVTHDARYFNSNLAEHPFGAWGNRK